MGLVSLFQKLELIPSETESKALTNERMLKYTRPALRQREKIKIIIDYFSAPGFGIFNVKRKRKRKEKKQGGKTLCRAQPARGD